jgi:cell surface protein SprA
VRGYNVGYDLTKNIKTTFSATNRAIFEEGNSRVDRKLDPAGYREYVDTLRSQIGTFGRTMDYTHNYSISANLPLDKFPLTDWLSLNGKYAGTFNWQRSPLGQSEFGNTIQNNRTINFTGQANFVNLYNKVPFFKRVLAGGKAARGKLNVKDSNGDGKDGKPNQNDQKKEEKAKEDQKKEAEMLAKMTPKEKKKYLRKKKRDQRKKRQAEKAKEKPNVILAAGSRILMTVRNVSGTYALSDGTLLPGYNQETRNLGMNSNTFGLTSFVFGKQGYDILGRANNYDISALATNNNWLVQNSNLNKAFTTTHSANLNLRANLEPLKDVIIEMTLNRNYSNNSSEFYRWNSTSTQFESQSRVQTSTLTYSNLTIGSAFALINARDFSSETFNTLLANRESVSTLLGQQNSNSSSINGSGYYTGYSGSQQEVVLGSFLTAYSKTNVNNQTINPIKNMPLPNWSINYNGLTKYAFAKKYVKNFVIKHGYSSTVSVNGMQTNLNAELDANGNASARDINNNFISGMQVQNVVITERFSPLIGFDATWNIKGQGLITKFEYKKDRSATLSLNNNQVTEVLGNEMIIGTGYKFSKVKLPIQRVPASDVNIRFDFSFRDNLTVIRKVVETTNQATAGQRVISIKASADYNLSQNLTLQFYYDQVLNTPKIATAYPTQNLSTGFKLRFNLAGVQ